MMSKTTQTKDFDLTIRRDELNHIAPEVVTMLREFVYFGQCRQKNTFERKSLAEHFAALSDEALRKFPSLKLNHVGAKTLVID